MAHMLMRVVQTGSHQGITIRIDLRRRSYKCFCIVCLNHGDDTPIGNTYRPCLCLALKSRKDLARNDNPLDSP
jgi:hypothetical protein